MLGMRQVFYFACEYLQIFCNVTFWGRYITSIPVQCNKNCPRSVAICSLTLIFFIGYERELTFRRTDKAFSAWGDRTPGSAWFVKQNYLVQLIGY